MFGWRKNTNRPEGEIVSDMARAIRTMEDDLAGKPFADESSTAPSEPPVNFVPDPGQGAPFFSAESSPAPAPSGSSPFLASQPQESLAPSTPHDSGSAAVPPLEVTPAVPETYAALRKDMVVSPTPLAIFKSRKKVLLYGGLGLVTLLLLGGGVYFFFFRSSDETPSAQSTSGPGQTGSPMTAPVPPTVPIDIPGLPAATKYSATQPNFLSINTETATAESLRTLLLQTGMEVKDEKLPGAVEFLVRDQNYNPLAFSRFSYLLKLDLPEALLVQIDESFSLIVSVDEGRPRLGLILTVRDEAAFQSELTKAEKSLAQDINPLFLDTTTAPKTNLLFRSGSYAGVATRFANVDESINLSVDYAVRGKEWFLATSKNTLRAMLDENPAIPR